MKYCLYLCLASAVVLGATFQHTWDGYTIAVPAVSLVLTGVMLLMYKFATFAGAILGKGLFSLPKAGSITVESLLVLFLWVWWLVGASILTFEGPFTIASNGYFGCWAALVIATFWLFGSTESLQNIQFATVTASVILIIATCVGDHLSSGEGIFAIILASLTLALVLFLMSGLVKLAGNVSMVLMLLLGAAWIAGAIVLTFFSPFTLAGNGYFATWAGLFCVLQLALGDATFKSALLPLTK